MKQAIARFTSPLLLALAMSGGAHATDYDLFGLVGAKDSIGVVPAMFASGTEVSFLTLSGPSDVTVSLSGIDVDFMGFVPAVYTFSHLKLVSATDTYDFGSPSGPSLSGHLGGVLPGSYWLVFDTSASSIGGAFQGTASVTAVPEPASLGIALVGLMTFAGVYQWQLRRGATSKDGV